MLNKIKPGSKSAWILAIILIILILAWSFYYVIGIASLKA